MKKVLQWFVLIVMIVTAVALGVSALMASPYWYDVLVVLATAAFCGTLFLGVIIGAFWTFVAMKNGGRLASSAYVAAEHTEGARWRTIQDGIRMIRDAPTQLPPPERPWLPPLQPFDAEFEEVEGD